MLIQCVECFKTTTSLQEPWRPNVPLSNALKGICPSCQAQRARSKGTTYPQTTAKGGVDGQAGIGSKSLLQMKQIP